MDEPKSTPIGWDPTPGPPAPIAEPPRPEGEMAVEPVAAAPIIRYGGFWRRTGAFFLDAFVIAVASVPATVLTLLDYGSAASTLVTILTGVVGIAYLPFCWTKWGQTVGFALMGLRVVRIEDLQRISWWRALGRLLALYPAFAFFGIGIMWVGWEPRKRGWHDRLADTVVLRIPSLRESHSPRRKWAIALASVGAASWVFSLAVGITIAVAAATHGLRDANGVLRGTQLLSLSALQAGDCFDEFLGSIEQVSAVRCSEPHAYEVFAAPKMHVATYPTDEELQQLAGEQCIPAFDRYIGIDFESSEWYVGFAGPDRTSWLLGNRTLTCYLANEDASKIRGSAKGSAR